MRTVVDAIEEHPRNVVQHVSHAGNAVVTRHACALIMILSHKSDHNRNAVSEHGGLRTVVDAIEEHPRNVDLLCAACGALWSRIN